MPHFSIELDLTGRLAVVVGLGPVGRRKVLSLVAAGANVVAVDPSSGAGSLPEVANIRVVAEAFRGDHLDGASLVFAAATPEVNRLVVAEAKARGIWVNAASEPSSGDFTVPAVWDDGMIRVTVSTSGVSPALAASLRDRAGEAIGPAAAGLIAVLAELRPRILEEISDPEERRRILRDWGDPGWLELAETEGLDAVRARIDRVIARSRS